jgi:hypothetical protein
MSLLKRFNDFWVVLAKSHAFFGGSIGLESFLKVSNFTSVAIQYKPGSFLYSPGHLLSTQLFRKISFFQFGLFPKFNFKELFQTSFVNYSKFIRTPS